jgi:HK97 gp10 family phage protein
MAPWDTGALRASIHVESLHPPLQRTIADGVEYGVFQEFGTYRMAAQPFMTPAVERQRPSLTKAWKELFGP